MAELDKKIQKAQTDLVQAVLEAQEKRNLERVDILVTNAIKQLKMSRFKPDQTTCLSLTYLARISPKVFQQSSAIKEVLKSLLRRDNGPANIKGKNDIVLPVLAANILLACCDAIEVRSIILHKIEQWLGSNQKVSELIQHLLATLCMKCQADHQTIVTLIDMRHYWLQYLDENFDIYGSVPSDLCASTRKLLHSETNSESLVAYLRFLIKHDADINCLGKDISKFIIERPISLNSMLKEDSGIQLIKMILKIFIKLFTHLKNSSIIGEINTIRRDKIEEEKLGQQNEDKTKQLDTVPGGYANVIVKLEPSNDTDDKTNMNDVKSETKVENETKPLKDSTKDITDAKSKNENRIKTDANSLKSDEQNDDSSEMRMIQSFYVKLPNCSKIIMLDRFIIEAIFTILALIEVNDDCKEEFNELINCWLVEDKINQPKIATIYEDFGSTTVYNLPDKLRQKLIHSSNDLLVEMALYNATTAQLIKLLQQFGSPITTINKILKKLESIKDIELIKYEIKVDFSYFNHLMEFYSSIGALGAKELHKRLDQVLS